MSVGERIKNRRKQVGFTADQLAEILGVNRATVYRYESEAINKLPVDVVKKLADALATSPAALMGWSEEEQPQGPMPQHGHGASEQDDLHRMCYGHGQADFYIKMVGDSMIGARIHDGDLVFVRRQNTVEEGKIAAVLIDGVCTLKRVFYTNGRLQLMAENPAYAPVDAGDRMRVVILGQAIAFQGEVV